MRLHSRSKLSLELIGYQHDDFGKALEGLISGIKGDIALGYIDATTSSRSVPNVAKMERLIFNRLGLNVKLNINDPDNYISAIPSFFNFNTQMVYKNIRDRNIDSDNGRTFLDNAVNKGWVDTKKAKVGGFFSENVNYVYLNIYQLSTLSYSKATSKELVGLLLHELGHIFNSCEYANRLAATNLVMEDIAFSVSKKSSNLENYIYVKLKEVYPDVDEVLAAKIADANNNVILSMELSKAYTSIVTHISNDVLDPIGERLADRFAGRFGYGRELIGILARLEGLEFPSSKLMKLGFTVLNIVLIYYMVSIFISTVMLTLIALLTGNPIFIVTAIIYSLVTYLCNSLINITIGISGESEHDEIYTRIKQIRNDTVNGLKDSNLPKSIVKEQLETIYQLDEMLKLADSSIGNNPLVKRFFTFLSPTAKKLNSSKEYNNLMDGLANSDLFIQSAKLKNK